MPQHKKGYMSVVCSYSKWHHTLSAAINRCLNDRRQCEDDHVYRCDGGQIIWRRKPAKEMK